MNATIWDNTSTAAAHSTKPASIRIVTGPASVSTGPHSIGPGGDVALVCAGSTGAAISVVVGADVEVELVVDELVDDGDEVEASGVAASWVAASRPPQLDSRAAVLVMTTMVTARRQVDKRIC